MYCTISPSRDRKYILMKYNGDINTKMAIDPIIECHTLGKQLNIQRYLVDVTNANNVGAVLDSYHFACRDIQLRNGIDTPAIVVVVASPDDHSHDPAEPVFNNPDLNVKLFQDIDVALHHLLNA